MPKKTSSMGFFELEKKISRRQLMQSALGIAMGALCKPSLFAAPSPPARFSAYPFSLGVASGYPAPNGFTMWTRLACAPLQADGGMTQDNVDVQFEVAEDEHFRKIVDKGQRRATYELAHSLRIELDGLRPGRWYWYRFMAGNEVSVHGRSRTAELPGQGMDRCKFAIGSCQHFEQGYYAAHRHLLDEDLDLMLFLGDYIYESGWGDALVRRHVGGEANDLADYRVRYAQYKTDPDLQRLHQFVPWGVIWDDHEVDNDWAADQSEHLDPSFVRRKAAAFQAFLEHMPLPTRMWPKQSAMRIYDRLRFGDLAQFYLLDDRQYRSSQACSDPYKGGGSTEVDPSICTDLEHAGRTLLGETQSTWLGNAFKGKPSRWNIIAQQTLMSRLDNAPGPGTKVWTDGWDGYPQARRLLLRQFEASHLSNPIVVGGDIHATLIADIHAKPEDVNSKIVASEFCGTSITSQGRPEGWFDGMLKDNPHVAFANSHQRGYLSFTLDKNACEAKVRVLESEKHRDSKISTLQTFIVENGEAGVKKA